ncbi:MAG TPA: sigma 54-interacting transcriptional regulator [Myxococcales bacterium]|nr:sigma 54-interacting transcriptional regulator [Myxococcales bacterium]
MGGVTTDTVRLQEGQRPGGLRLVVLEEGISTVHALPERGSVVIGRSKQSDVRLEDSSVSRRHAVLHVDPVLRLEDLGSANGTHVRERLLRPKEIVELQPGDVVEVGRALLVVQRQVPPGRASRLVTHDYFEARLEDECARGERGPLSFAVARLRWETETQDAVLGRIAPLLRPGDVVGAYGPTDLELLLVDTAPDEAEEFVGELARAAGQDCAAGLACFPRGGRSAAALLQRANAPLRSGSSPESERIFSARSDEMDRLRVEVAHVAGTDMTVLILGETGVGKGVLAEEVHRRSRRANGPFVAINCASFTDALFESELFGYERGAFTGAQQAKTGLIESAEGGTLFLDEIAELPLSMQAKLLRVLEDREVRRVGALKAKKVDVRVIAATNRALSAEVRRGGFRSDLYFRLDVLRMVVPPLRERVAEIEGLARSFLQSANPALTLSPEALEALQRYSWPGNIRELRNAMDRAAVLCGAGAITPAHLPRDTVRATYFTAGPAVDPSADAVPLKQRILDALEQTAGNQSRAAKLLGVSRRTLVNWMDRYDLPRPHGARAKRLPN